MSVSSEFSCKCGQKGWITEGKETPPCPECKRTYVGYYDKKNLTIAGKVKKDKKIQDLKKEISMKIERLQKQLDKLRKIKK